MDCHLLLFVLLDEKHRNRQTEREKVSERISHHDHMAHHSTHFFLMLHTMSFLPLGAFLGDENVLGQLCQVES